LAAARKADLILWVVDGSDANPDARAELERYWAALGGPKAQSFGIMTKSDLWTGASPGFFEDKMSVAHCSALTGQGVHEAAVAVVHRCQQWVGRAQGEVILTREEDRRAVEECLSHLNRAMGASEEDLFASDLKQALRALSRLIGDTVPDDILGTIFSGFCIGK
jgi:tRNA modification GTPase